MKINTEPLLLILAAAVIEGVAIYAIKRRMNELGQVNVFPIYSLIGYVANFLRSPAASVAAAAFILSPLLWFTALSKVELSWSYPLSIVFKLLFILLMSSFFLHEKLTVNRILGAIFAVMSLFLLNK